jgi:hypothetical protein
MTMVVSTASDQENGDTSSVAALLANPGPDGISLREAIHATNNDPGARTIGFAPMLAGATIGLDSVLPPLTGGGVTIEGDIDLNGAPDVTLRPSQRFVGVPDRAALHIASSGNRLHALVLDGFPVPGVYIRPYWGRPPPLPTRGVLADNVVSDLVIRGSGGIAILPIWGGDCGLPFGLRPCASDFRFVNTTISGNTVDAGTGIGADLHNVGGGSITGMTVTHNTIRVGAGGIGVGIFQGGNATATRISDLLIARNAIEGMNVDAGIFVGAGVQRSQANTIERVRILKNRVRLGRRAPAPCCFAIVLDAGNDVWAEHVRPVNYPDGNVLRDVTVAGNSLSGSLAAGVRIQAGVDGGGSRNRVERVRVERNVISSTMMGKGVYLWLGDNFPPPSTDPSDVKRPTGNHITGIAIQANRITTGKRHPLPGETDKRTAGGVVLLGGWHGGRRGVIRDIRITRNRIATTHFGIRLIGGLEPAARGNRLSCVRLAGNRITGTRRRVSVRSNAGGASGNRASLGGC